MAAEPLRATEAARLLGIPTRDLLRLIYEQRIRYVIVDGIAHVPVDAIDEYRASFVSAGALFVPGVRQSRRRASSTAGSPAPLRGRLVEFQRSSG